MLTGSLSDFCRFPELDFYFRVLHQKVVTLFSRQFEQLT